MDYVDLLRKKKLKATPQRISILNILDKEDHPTIEEMYNVIKKEHPSISLATIYKNLNTLKEEGLIVEVNICNDKMRYDIYDIPHIHVSCKNCKKVFDINHDDELLKYSQYLEKQIGGDILQVDMLVTVSKCKFCPSCK